MESECTQQNRSRLILLDYFSHGRSGGSKSKSQTKGKTTDYTDGTDIRNPVMSFNIRVIREMEVLSFWRLMIAICLGFGNWDLGFGARD